MPQVPVYGAPNVQQAGIPNVHMGADASLESFGGGKSLEQAGAATDNLGRTALNIATEEKQKADQLAFMSADSQLSAAQTKIQVSTSKMLGKDAMGAPDVAKKQWDDSVQSIQQNMSNDAQKIAFARSATSRWDELNKNVQVHVSDQMQKFDDNETSGYLETSRNAAVVNAGDDEKVQNELDRQKAVLSEWAQRKGIPTDSETFKAKLADQISGTSKDIIAARLDKDSPDNVAQAKAYFEAHKDQMNAQDMVTAQKAIDTSEVTSLGLQAWNQMKGMKLSDGNPDEQKMQQNLYARSDLSDERKEQIWSFVKGRAKEEVLQKNMNEAANDRSFMNNAIQARQQGKPMQDALKLAGNYATDDYDQSVKENAVRQIYAPPTQSDPHTYLALWEGIQDNTAAKTEIEQAFTKNQINVGDYRTLSEAFYKSNTEGKNSEEKQTWDRIKIAADQQYGSNKQDKDSYLYVLHTISKGKTPDELWKISQDKLKGDPNTGIWGVFQSSQWKTDLQRTDAQNTAWGKAYQDIGTNETKAIGQGVLYSGKEKWGIGDVDSFAASLGGYDKIKSGTPANNAMQSLISAGQLVTPANVKAVLNTYPDGKAQLKRYADKDH